MSTQELQELIKRARHHHVPISQVRRSSPLDSAKGGAPFLITDGIWLMRQQQDGLPATYRLLQAGEAAGAASVLQQNPVPFTLQAATPIASLVCYPGVGFANLLKQEVFSRLWLKLLAKEIETEQRLRALLAWSLDRRLAATLLELSSHQQRIRVTHKNIAHAIGSTRETISVCIGEWRDQGILDTGTHDERHIRVVNRGALEQIAFGGHADD